MSSEREFQDVKFNSNEEEMYPGQDFYEEDNYSRLDANNNIDDETVFSLDEYSQDSDLFMDQQGGCQPNPKHQQNSQQVPYQRNTSKKTTVSSSPGGSTSNSSERPMGRLQRETPRQISGERQMYFPAMFVEEFRLGNVVFNIPGILKDSLRPSDSMNIKFDFIGHNLNKEFIHSRLANLSTSLQTGENSECNSVLYDLDELKNHTISNFGKSPVSAANPNNISSSLSTVSN